MSSELLRLYEPDLVLGDGYPAAWHHPSYAVVAGDNLRWPPIKDVIRDIAGDRCERCGHPYRKDDTRISERGEWSPCDPLCTHGGPFRCTAPDGVPSTRVPADERDFVGMVARDGWLCEAQWRILTVHHLNGVKWDCRWWNLAALCQRCHLTIQSKVLMERVYPLEHSEWFKPHAAGWYASAYLGEDLPREETLARLDELLALERLA